MQDDLNCRVVGRTGPILTLALVRQKDDPLGIVEANLCCDLRGRRNQYLFALPMSLVTPQRMTQQRLTIIDLVIMGHPLDARSTFSLPVTLDDAADQLSQALKREEQNDPDYARSIKASCFPVFSGLYNLNVISEAQFSACDAMLSPYLELKIVTSEGGVVELNSILSTREMAGLLANYFTDERADSSLFGRFPSGALSK